MDELLKPSWRIPGCFLVFGLLISSAVPSIGWPMVGAALLVFAGAGICLVLIFALNILEWITISLLRMAGCKPSSRYTGRINAESAGRWDH